MEVDGPSHRLPAASAAGSGWLWAGAITVAVASASGATTAASSSVSTNGRHGSGGGRYWGGGGREWCAELHRPVLRAGSTHFRSCHCCMIKIIIYVDIGFIYRKANILHKWSEILHKFYGNKGVCHGCRSY